MEKIKTFPILQPTFEDAVAEFDKCINDNNMSSVVLNVVENEGCVVLVRSFEDARKLAGDYTKWCICHHEESWEKYSEGKVQLFIYDHTKGRNHLPDTLIGVTLNIVDFGPGRLRLEYDCAFNASDQPLEDLLRDKSKEAMLQYVHHELLYKKGNFGFEELLTYLVNDLGYKPNKHE